MTIKYFCYYGCNNPRCLRQNSPAADTKVDYVVGALNRAGYDVDIISFAPITTNGGFVKGAIIRDEHTTIRYFSCFGKGASIFGKTYNRLLYKVNISLWCLLNLHAGEKIIVYHSLRSDRLFIKLKSILHLRIVGDIEEIYQDVHPQTKSVARREYEFINLCSSYIFPNSVLNDKLNHEKKPHLVIHGIYKSIDLRENKQIGDKIDLIYSGTFDPVKGGALSAVYMAAFLSDKYRLHITGFGSDAECRMVKDRICEIRSTTKAEIVFHGYLDNESYQNLLCKCVVGLCTQDPTTALNLTSFPSKILQYMSNGLIVVAGKNKAIEESRVSSCLYLYEDPSPNKIAEVVMSIKDFSVSSQTDLLKSLDERLPKELVDLLES